MQVEPLAPRLLHNAADCTLHLPAAIGSFTDFFAGIHHARNGGMRRDPSNPLNPNYKYVPVAYHSRASSVRPSGVLMLAQARGKWLTRPSAAVRRTGA